jgi:hypothetical protein
MTGRIAATIAALAVGTCFSVVLAFSETKVATEGPGLKPGWPSWYIEGSASDPLGPFPAGRGGRGAGAGRGAGGGRGAAPAADNGMPPRCAHSAVCQGDGTRDGGVTDGTTRVAWKPNTNWTFAYPWELPAGGGDVTGVGVDTKDNVWVWQRNQPNVPALFKFGPDRKMLFSVPPELTDHTMPFRGHGMGVDADGNAWVLNESGATVKEFSPDGKLLLSLGTKGHRGDWDESKEQRLLWEPVTIGFGPNSDVYIFEGHGDESPNDVGSDDPTNQIGVARVLHLDKNGKFINQWFGNDRGPGKFNSAHGSAVDPVTGDVWVGDREDYRIVVFTANGHFLRTIQMRNLICALYFDNHPGPRFGTLWFATGMDGQVVRIDRDGNVLEVAGGNRKGGGEGQFNEATNMSSDSKGHLVVADTQEPRATELIPPASASTAKK